jgi:hypothetical protein
MNGEQVRIFRVTVTAYLKVPFQHSPQEPEEIHRKLII